MKPFDEEQAKAVWERVLAGRTPPAAPEPVEEKEAARAAMAEAEPALCPEELLKWIQAEKDGACRYALLARRAGGEAGRELTMLGRQTARQAGELSAAYYILTGERACVCPEAGAAEPCLAAALRRQYQKQRELAETYQTLAGRDTLFTELFYQLAGEKEGQGRRLFRLLQGSLRQGS